MSDLKPCPFCGKPPTFTDRGNGVSKSRSTTVTCTGCKFSKTVGAIRNTLEWTRAQCIAAWNRRAE